MIALLYVSRSLIKPADRADIVDDILAVALARNTMLGITGLLIASPGHFAQLLEGPEPGVEAVLASIVADSRHTACHVLRRAEITSRRCPRWRMARFERENFGSAHIDPLLHAAHGGTDGDAARPLERLIAMIVDEPEIAPSLIRS